MVIFIFGSLCAIYRLSLLAYNPLAMGILSGKYLSDGGPADARMNLFRGLILMLFIGRAFALAS